MSPRLTSMERRPVRASSRIASWLWALYHVAQPYRARMPVLELLGRTRELIRVVESLLYLAPRDLELLAALAWDLTREVCASLEIADRQPDAWGLLSELEDVDQAADVELRRGAVLLLAQMLKAGRVLQLHAHQEIRDMVCRWVVRDLHARRPCDDLLRFCLRLGVPETEVLSRVEQLEAALPGEVVHA